MLYEFQGKQKILEKTSFMNVNHINWEQEYQKYTTTIYNLKSAEGWKAIKLILKKLNIVQRILWEIFCKSSLKNTKKATVNGRYIFAYNVNQYKW